MGQSGGWSFSPDAGPLPRDAVVEDAVGEDVEELSLPADGGGSVDEECLLVLGIEAFGVVAEAVEGWEVRVVGWDEADVFGVVVR